MTKAPVTHFPLGGREDARALAKAIVGEHVRSMPRSAKIVIKPNVCAPKAPATGVTTHHEIVEGVLEALTGFQNVALVESNAASFDFSEKMSGWQPTFLEEYPEVKLLNLSELPTRPVELKGLARTYAIEMSTLMLDCDLLINIPVLKTHVLTGVTIGLKNLYGLIPLKAKNRFHVYIHDIVFALSRWAPPSLTIVDGLVGMDGQGPVHGDPVGANCIIAGTDIALVDAMGCLVMGIDPWGIKYLRDVLGFRFAGDCVRALTPQLGSVRGRAFRQPRTVPTQVARALGEGATSIDAILELVDLPQQTRRNIPSFVDELVRVGAVACVGDRLAVERANWERYICLFPEAMPHAETGGLRAA